MTSKEGFIYICVKDKYISEAIDTIYVPIGPMRPFVPLNFVIKNFTRFEIN